MTDNEEKHRERAHKIWEEEGRPEGRHLDHWQRAEKRHQETEQEVDRSSSPKQDVLQPVESKGKKSASGKTPRPIRE